MIGEGPQDRYIVPALRRGLGILCSFDRSRPVLTMVELARINALPRATTFRLVHTLEAMGFLVRETVGQGYRLGPAVLSLGFGYLAGLELPEIARPVLERLRDATGASTHLAVRDGVEIVYLVQVSGPSALTSNIGVGSRLPAHGSTMGRALLLDLDAEALQTAFGTGFLVAMTDQTPTTVEALVGILAKDRSQGYVASRSFYERGLVSLAAPVRDAAGAIVAAVSVVTSEHVLDFRAMHGVAKDRVLESAAEISRWLGHQPGGLSTAAE